MDPRTGELHQVDSVREALARGLVPVPPEDVQRVKRMTLSERVDWAKTRERSCIRIRSVASTTMTSGGRFVTR